MQEFAGREATNADRQGRIDYWQFEKLHWIRDHLEGERKAFYDQMLAEHGEPRLAFFRAWSGRVRWGWQSPATVEELSEMGFESAVKYAASWRAKPGDHDGPSLQGLSQTFELYIATKPSEFAAHARLLIGKRVELVRPFLTKIGDAVAGEADFDIGPVFDLCRWVIEQPTHGSAAGNVAVGEMSDENWQAARSEVSRLLKAVCCATKSGAPKYPVEALRKDVWDLIKALCNDPPESMIVFDAEKQDPRIYDYADLGINSDRGKAIDAVLEYARWVANHLKQKDGEADRVPGGFGAMPEVRACAGGPASSGQPKV